MAVRWHASPFTDTSANRSLSDRRAQAQTGQSYGSAPVVNGLPQQSLLTYPIAAAPEGNSPFPTSVLDLNASNASLQSVLENGNLFPFWQAIQAQEYMEPGGNTSAENGAVASSVSPGNADNAATQPISLDLAALGDGAIQPFIIPPVDQIGNGTTVSGLQGISITPGGADSPSNADLLNPSGVSSPQIDALTELLDGAKEQGTYETQLAFLQSVPGVSEEMLEEFQRLNGTGGIPGLNGDANLAFAESITEYIRSGLGDPSVSGADYVAQQLAEIDPETNPYLYETLKRVESELTASAASETQESTSTTSDPNTEANDTGEPTETEEPQTA